MLNVNDIINELGLEPILLADGEREVTGGYAGDLLSWVMGRANAGDAWVTIMSNMNVAAVAQLADVACVVFAEGVKPDQAAIDAASLHEINLLGSTKGTFELCHEIAELLRRE